MEERRRKGRKREETEREGMRRQVQKKEEKGRKENVSMGKKLEQKTPKQK